MARFTDFHEDLPAEVPEIVMNRIPRIRRWCGMPAGLAGVPPTAVAAAPATPGGGAMPSGGTGSVAGSLSFRRIVDLPFEACVAALESWLHTGQDGDLQIGPSFLRGPAEHDRDSGTCRIEVRLARRPLRPPLRMRLDVQPLVPAALKDRARTHPLPTGPAHRNLLPGRPPPAGLIDPHAAAALAGTAL